MSLENYWPSLEEINRCIKAEAENSSDEVLLAVHQEFPLVYLKVGPDGKVMPESKTTATEEELLKYFIGHAPSGSHVLPITGSSGVGKSHLIRMLDTYLRRLPDAHRYLVIRIPKSASLRRIVELILETEPLKDQKYNTVKEEFTKALADVPLHDAVVRFQAELVIALKEEELRLVQSNLQDPANISIRERCGHARDLPMLMTDAETVNHFRLNVFPRIIQRSVNGAQSEGGMLKEIDPTASQFNVEDLDLSGIELTQSSKQVSTYYKLALTAQEGRGKTVAVSVLNDVIDIATSQLYKLNQSLGGMTLAEVILEIRRLLLVDKRELVILVEDFAALVGIQDTLAKVLIQEGETSKGKEFATIRSAIAVTDGYLAGRDTLATRVGREWVVESRDLSVDESLRRTKSLVASYLNAARFGEASLKKHYQQVPIAASSTDKPWSPPIYSEGNEEVSKILDAFGKWGDVPLFPFTEAAIESLARMTLTSGSALVFNPRYVIKNIIREILMAGRDAFINKQFPPLGINAKKPSSDVAQWLTSLHLSDDHRKRYERLVTIWGNDPKTRSEIGYIPREVFEVFGLPQPEIDYIPPTPKSTSSEKSPNDNVAPEVSFRQEQQINEYQAVLENWVQNGTMLEQAIANKIRKALETLINQRIDWNAERCLKREIKSDKFSIPNARGEQGIATNAIKIAPNSNDTDGRLRAELMALLRYFEVYKPSADYESVDDDMARIANLVERLLPDALLMVRASVKKQNQSTILALAANSRLLGIYERGRTMGAISSFLFADIEAIETLPDNSPQSFRDWRILQNNADQIRPQLWQLLIEASGCFQGTGKAAYGIDIVRLLEDYPEDEDTIEFANLQGLASELKQSLQNMSNIKVSSRLKQVLQEASRIQKIITEDLGTDIDKQVVIDVFKKLAGALTEMGAWSNYDIGISSQAFTNLCEEFRSTALKESLSILEGFEEVAGDEQSPAKRVVRGAQLRLLPLLKAELFLSSAKKIICAAESHAQTLESQYKGVSPTEKAQEIVCDFNDLVINLGILQNGEA